MSIKLGNTTLKCGIILAPMAGFTDYAFRRICRENGAEFTISEMVSAKALCYEMKAKKGNVDKSKTVPLASVKDEEMPMAIQLFGGDPEFVAQAASMIENCSYRGCLSKIPPTAIDINMGCPMHKIVSNGEGSALMKNPALAGAIVEQTAKVLKNIPVTVKIRAGWDSEHKNAVEMARIAEGSGASMICVHARTREQMYNPGIDIKIIEQVKNAVKIPVIGNGDIYSAKDAMDMLDKTGCDGLMIGRGSLGNPRIFKEIISLMNGEEYIEPTVQEKIEMCLYHIDLMIESKGEYVSSAEIKKHAALYIKGVKNAASVRDRIMKTSSTQQIRDILSEI